VWFAGGFVGLEDFSVSHFGSSRSKVAVDGVLSGFIMYVVKTCSKVQSHKKYFSQGSSY